MPTGEPAGSIPNVGPFARAIKGKGDGPNVIASECASPGDRAARTSCDVTS